MEEKSRKGNVLTIVLFVLLLISVGIICYLLGGINSKESNQNNVLEEDENNQNNILDGEENIITPTNYSPKCNRDNKSYLTDIDENKYNNILEYISEQNNVNISLNYCKSRETFEEAEYILTDNEVNSVLNELKNSTYSISKSGIGGAGIPTLKISYERNNNQYYISYWGLVVMDSNDGNIYKIVDKSVENTLSDPQFCLYTSNKWSNTAQSLVDKYSA